MKINRTIQEIVFSCLIGASLLFGQSSVKVIGRVIDASTSEPLAGANVQVVGSALGAATNSAGLFEIENLLNGQYTLKAAFIGYKSVEKDVNVTDDQPAYVTFLLEQKVIELTGVQVTADRQDNPSPDITVMSWRDIERTQATTVGELLAHCPGVEIHDQGPQGEKKISIRGSRSNQVLVLLDGVKLNDELNGDVDLSTVPVNSIARVEVHKGGASAEYGGGAIGGVINIITANSSEDHVQLTAKTGSYGFHIVEPSISAKWKSGEVLTSFQAKKSDGEYPFAAVQPDDNIREGTRVNADMRSHNFFGHVGYAMRNHRWSVAYQKFTSERGNPGRIYYLTPFARSKLNRDIWGGDYRFAAEKMAIDLQIRSARSQSETSNFRPLDSDVPFGSTPEFHFYDELRTTDFTTTFRHQTASWLSQRVGYENRRLQFTDQNLLTPGNTAIGSAEDKSFSFFFKQHLQFELAKVSLKFSPAIRFDEAQLQNQQESRSERQWCPQLNVYISVGAGSQLYLKGDVGRAFRMPTFADLFYQDFRVQGKADLLPEKNLNRQVGFGAQFEFIGDWHIDATGFQNTIDDMIVWRLGSFEFFRPYNTDVEMSGEEYSLIYSTFANVFTLSGSYMHLRALNKNENITLFDKLLPFRPQHSVKASLDLDFGEWRSSLLLRSVGERYITEANTKVMPPYTVLDWTADWSLTFGKIKSELQVAIYNVTDEDYQILRDMPLPGREWRLGMSVRYK